VGGEPPVGAGLARERAEGALGGWVTAACHTVSDVTEEWARHWWQPRSRAPGSYGIHATLSESADTQLCVRTKSHELEGIGVGLAVNQNEVGLDVAISMVFPVAREGVVAIVLGQLKIPGKDFDDLREVGLQGSAVFSFGFALEVALKA
jgi:hypothetical protein